MPFPDRSKISHPKATSAQRYFELLKEIEHIRDELGAVASEEDRDLFVIPRRRSGEIVRFPLRLQGANGDLFVRDVPLIFLNNISLLDSEHFKAFESFADSIVTTRLERAWAMILDANIDPVSFTTSAKAAMFNSGADTDLVFEKFLSLCQRAGPANCKLAGDGDVSSRVRTFVARLRHGPVPAPRGPAPCELRYGDVQLGIWSLLGSPSHGPNSRTSSIRRLTPTVPTLRSPSAKVETPCRRP